MDKYVYLIICVSPLEKEITKKIHWRGFACPHDVDKIVIDAISAHPKQIKSWKSTHDPND